MAGMITFNVAQLIATPVIDAFGNVLANPNSVIIDGVQGIDLGISGSIQKLMAEKQFAISGIRGDFEVKGKIKGTKQSAELLSGFFTGQGYDSTTPFTNVYLGVTGAIEPDSPSNGIELYIGTTSVYGPALGIPIGAAAAGSALGVYDQYGNPWGTRVPYVSTGGTQPAVGTWMYGISHITGHADNCFRFNCLDIYGTSSPIIGAPVIFQPYVSFTTIATLTANMRHLKLNNVISGSTPVVQLVAATSFQGKAMTLILPWTISDDLSFLSMRNLEFSGFELSFSCFPDNTTSETIIEGFFLE